MVGLSREHRCIGWKANVPTRSAGFDDAWSIALCVGCVDCRVPRSLSKVCSLCVWMHVEAKRRDGVEWVEGMGGATGQLASQRCRLVERLGSMFGYGCCKHEIGS